MKRLCLLTLLIAIAIPASAQSWEFNGSGTEGWWSAHSVSALYTSNGCLVGDIIGSDPYIIGPSSPTIDAGANHYIDIRMKSTAGGTAEFFWATPAEPYHKAGRQLGFPVTGDGQFHDIIVDMSKNSQWTGTVQMLRLDPEGSAISGHFEVDYIRVLAVPPSNVSITTLAAADRFAFQGEQFAMNCTVLNDSIIPLLNVQATLTVAGQTIVSNPTQTIAQIDAGQQATLTWQVHADTQRVSDVSVSVTATGITIPMTRTCQLVVSAPRPTLPVDAQTTAQAWTDAVQNVVLENSKLRMVFLRSTYGYAVAELYVRNGSNWDLMAASSPLSQARYKPDTGPDVNVIIAPASVAISNLTGGKQAAFGFDCPDGNGGSWRGSLSFSLYDNDDTVKTDFSLYCTAARKLLAWVGPSLCPGNRSFGSTKSQALFPGLEWLVGSEKSSNTLESAPGFNMKVVPHPYKITVPLMAVSGQGSLAAILWNALQNWNGTDACPSAEFSSPNWFEGQNNHLMQLFVPSIPRWMNENSTVAPTPFDLPAGAQLTMSSYYFVRAGGEVLDAVDKWYSIYGVPAMPGGTGLLEQGLQTARTGFMTTLWDSTKKGWLDVIGWDTYPYPEFTQDLFVDSLMESNAAAKASLRSRCDEAIQSALSLWGSSALGSGSGSHIPAYRLPFFVGHLNQLPARMKAEADGVRGSQQADGGWFVPINSAHPELTTPGTKELGSCAGSALTLLRYRRMSGDSASYNAGINALNYMDTFVVPRAGQVWEVPQHAPDIYATANAVGAYVEGYAVTGNTAYLDKARYWARAGLPFVYTWKAPDRQVMDYGTIPVFGCSLFTCPWYGLPVQWNGFVYAYFINRLADFDNSYPWRTIAEGITRSGIQQMNASPYVGTLPDSMNILYSNTPNPVFINPDNIYKCASIALGRWMEVNTRRIYGTTKTAYVSTGGRIIFGTYNNALGQLIFKLKYPVGETCHTLVYCDSPVSVYKGSQLIPNVIDVDAVTQGWLYNSTCKCVVIKCIQDVDEQYITLSCNGALELPTQAAGPAQVKSLADRVLVDFTGTVTAGTDQMSNVAYVESDDRSSAIKLSFNTTPVIPIRVGDRVEVIGVTGTRNGERYIVRPDVRALGE